MGPAPYYIDQIMPASASARGREVAKRVEVRHMLEIELEHR